MDWLMLIKTFAVGGLICVVGQLLIDYTSMTPARILVLFVTLGVALTAVGLYQPLVDFAGSGATVPLTGLRVLPRQRGGGGGEGGRPARRIDGRSQGHRGRHLRRYPLRLCLAPSSPNRRTNRK